MNKPVAWIEPDVIPLTHIIKAVVRREQDEQYSIPLYIHPVKEQELRDEIEALKKQVVIWERSSKDRAIKLNICAIKVSELEKKLDTRTKELIGASFYEHDYKTMMVLDGNRVYPTVKELTLTDEQINILDNEVKYSELSLDWNEYMRRFARLVLKKAYYGEI